MDSLGIEYFPQEVSSKIRDESITQDTFRIKENESVICGFHCIDFIERMLAKKTLLDHTNLFSPNDYKNNNNKIFKYFKDKYGRRSKSRV